MIFKLKKYILFFFLIENIAVQAPFFKNFSDVFFYVFIVLGGIFLFDGKNWTKESIGKYGWMFLLAFIFIVYEFLIGTDYINQKTLLYLIAKISTFFIITTSLNSDFDFYEHKMIYSLSIFMALVSLYGLLFGGNAGSDVGRMSMGFSNANTTGSIGASLFGFMLYYSKDNEWNWKTISMCIIGLLVSLASGSRAAVIMLTLFIFFVYGLNIKTISIAATVIVVGIFVLPEFGIQSVGLQRTLGTIKGDVSEDRDIVREATIVMIKERPMVGWGFQAENQGAGAEITEMGSHCGYLDLAKFIGIPMAVIWLLVIAVTFAKSILTFIKYRYDLGVFLPLVIGLLIKAYVESLLHGVHEFDTNLFFVSLAILSAKSYNARNNINNSYYVR